MTLQELKAELDSDPKTLGFSGHATDNDADNGWCADKLNEDGASGETILRTTVNTANIITAIYSDATEFAKLTLLDLSRLNLLSPVGQIDPANIQAVVLSIFDNTEYPTIRAALIALGTVSASRAQKLGWPAVTISDIHNARAV